LPLRRADPRRLSGGAPARRQPSRRDHRVPADRRARGSALAAGLLPPGLAALVPPDRRLPELPDRRVLPAAGPGGPSREPPELARAARRAARGAGRGRPAGGARLWLGDRPRAAQLAGLAGGRGVTSSH